MKTSATGLDPQLAWALWYELAKLSFFLWDCYREDFLKLAEEERVCRGTDSEEDLEIEIPFLIIHSTREPEQQRRGRIRTSGGTIVGLSLELWNLD